MDIWMVTLSKALGSTGGLVAADADLIGAMKSSAPGVAVLTGAPTPAAIGAALAVLDVLEQEPEFAPIADCDRKTPAAIFLGRRLPPRGWSRKGGWPREGIPRGRSVRPDRTG
ncbi:aminotransferase class I/II-fold pyridoxal phosphate-dependent enzyme [Nocardia sp. NPDC047654]|uniref:aminotransferase class I/II-fold pyridoxal phosphate-dependent enzyme n=1 Tax=Nocardia sp. NPDC047654 TaxID=3364314 RepID=UPI00371195D4